MIRLIKLLGSLYEDFYDLSYFNINNQISNIDANY